MCGEWGSMDTDWTGVPDGVTCAACRRALRGEGVGLAPVAELHGRRRG
jgi:hypothetical protein